MRSPRRKPDHHSTTIAPHVRIAVAFLCLCIALMAAGGAVADESAPLSNLVTFAGQDYRVSAEDWVSLEPTHTAHVRKIGYGNVTDVNIATTATGTYSSDAIASPHVLYPGIVAEPVHSLRGLLNLIAGGTLARGTTSSIYLWGQAPNGIRTYTRVTNLGLRSCMSDGSFMACHVSR